jgi:hypothetical protein
VLISGNFCDMQRPKPVELPMVSFGLVFSSPPALPIRGHETVGRLML